MKTVWLFTLITINIATLTCSVRADTIKPSVATAFRDAPSLIDGVLDDSVWQEVTWVTNFVQRKPIFGATPAAQTSFAVIYDEENMYIGVRCAINDDAPLTTRLTRRDREEDFDTVSITLAPRGDGKTGYTFWFNPDGVQGDGVWRDDTHWDATWDGVWRVETRIGKDEWTAEVVIPFDQIRYPEGRKTWGLQVQRWISARKEESVFQQIPQQGAGFISTVGKLENVASIRARRPLQFRPEISFSYREKSTDWRGYAPEGFHYGIGGYGKIGLAADWVVDLALTPDFGQVEQDQAILNLSAYETQFPEKRPFFLESAGMFETPIQLFYSRRLGAAPPSITLNEGEKMVAGPAATSILSATKLTGRTEKGIYVGVIDAVLMPTEFRVKSVNGQDIFVREGSPWTNAAVLRLSYEPCPQLKVGVLGTALNPEQSKGAYSVGADWQVATPDLMYSFGGQVAATTRLEAVGSSNAHDFFGTTLRLARDGGKYFRANGTYEYYGNSFDPNDLGYLQRNKLHRYSAYLGLRKPERWGPFDIAIASLTLRGSLNLDGVDLGHWLTGEIAAMFGGGWVSNVVIDISNAHYDDMETRGGPLLYLPRHLDGWVYLTTPMHWKVGANMTFLVTRLPYGYGIETQVSGILRLGRLELSVTPKLSHMEGQKAYVDTVVDDLGTDRTIIGKRTVDQFDLNFGGTLVLRRDLTFQVQAQLLSYAADYSDYHWLQNKHTTSPIDYADEAADMGGTQLNMQTLLRWEYRPGSVLYVLYTHGGFADVPGSSPSLRKSLSYLDKEEREQIFMIKVSHLFD
ncbi:MAG: DUF5916 domain-containing protein [Myxococcota bacterium]|nr:DUF5916 domain-containing protein [Myxococcota bacterium]